MITDEEIEEMIEYCKKHNHVEGYCYNCSYVNLCDKLPILNSDGELIAPKYYTVKEIREMLER